MKKDFDEFSSVVKTEAASIANHTASAVKETLQVTFLSFGTYLVFGKLNYLFI